MFPLLIFLHCCVLQYFERAQIFYIFEKSLVSSLIALSFHTLRGSAWPIFLPYAIPPSLREWIIKDVFQSCSMIPYFSGKCYSFLSEGMEFSVSFRKSPLPSILALSFHTLKGGQLGLFPCKMLSTLISF